MIAGERVGVEAVEAIENVYQGSQRVFGSVASKLEKWGLFGKQVVNLIKVIKTENVISMY